MKDFAQKPFDRFRRITENIMTADGAQKMPRSEGRPGAGHAFRVGEADTRAPFYSPSGGGRRPRFPELNGGMPAWGRTLPLRLRGEKQA